MATLIITADDMGYSNVRDTGILKCWEERSITRASVLVNGVSAREACRRAKEKSLTIGLHLNLTEGVAVSADVPTLLEPHSQLPCGVFRGKMGFREALHNNLIDLGEIRRETVAQIEEFIAFTGSPPLYVDGHQHVHVLPGVCDVVASVMEEYGIRETRIPAENLTGCDWVDETRQKFYRQVSAQAQESRLVWKRHGIRSTCAFLGMVTMGKDMGVERLTERLTRTLKALHTGKPTHESHYSTGKSTSETHCTLNPEMKATDVSLFENGSDQGEKTPLTTALTTCIDQQNVGCFSIELMTHPGYPCSDSEQSGCGIGADEFAKSDERYHEIEVLSSPAFQEYLKLGGFVKQASVHHDDR